MMFSTLFPHASREVEEAVKNMNQKIDRAMVKDALPKPGGKPSPRRETAVMEPDIMAEYRKVAAEVGIDAAELNVEEFRNFLVEKDIPTFNLIEVVSYMDELVKKDNPTGFGWHWCPVRAKDAETPMTFGLPAQHSRQYDRQDVPASDFYESHMFQRWHQQGRISASTGAWINPAHANTDTGVQHVNTQASVPAPIDWRTVPTPFYTRTIPLHALKKIALIEREFTAAKVTFLVSDYTLAPHVVVDPDPFLMAVIPNAAVAHGKGRFIIDVWDEPGFGINKMLKP